MGINEIQLGPEPDGLEVTINRPDGDAIPVNEDGTLAVVDAGWGIDSDGNAYYSAGGAASGEGAKLAAAADELYLVGQGTTAKVVTVDPNASPGDVPSANGAGGITWGPGGGGGSGGFQTFTRPGSLAVETARARLAFPNAATITGIRATVDTAPAGASVIIDVLKNGVSIFTTQANRPTIAAAANQSASAVPDVTALAAGDYLQIEIAQIGSTVPGADLTVTVQHA